MVLLRIPAIQAYTGEKVASTLSKKLGTDVHVGRIDLGFLNRIIIDDILLYDQQHKPALRSSRMTARIELLPLTEGRIVVNSVQLFGTHATLYKPSLNAGMNIQFLLDSLASKDTTSHTPIDLHINSLIIRHSSISYDEAYQPKTPGTLNPHHLFLKDISAHAIIKELTDSTLNVHLRKLAFNEQSGLHVKQLSFMLEANNTNTHLNKFVLSLPSTTINIPYSEAAYRMKKGKIIPSTIRYKTTVNDTKVTPADLSFILPQLQQWKTPVDISLALNGTNSIVHIPHLEMNTDGMRLKTDGWIKDDEGMPSWHAHAQHLFLTPDFMGRIMETAGTKQNDIIGRLGDIYLTGEASGDANGIAANVDVESEAGSANARFNLSKEKNFTATVSSEGISLRRLLDNQQFGTAAALLDLKGNINKQLEIDILGNISAFDYQDYRYKNINLNGHYRANDISGQISIDDPNVALDIDGQWKDGKKNTFKLLGNIRHLCPQALHLTERWKNASFSGDIDANFTANTVNDVEGDVFIDDFTMITEEDIYQMESLHLKSGFSEDNQHFLRLTSDFAEAKLSGTFEINNIVQSVVNAIGSRLPTLPGLPKVKPQQKNDFTIDFHMKKSDWMEKILGIPVSLQQPVNLHISANDQHDMFEVIAEAPSLTYNGGDYKDVHVILSTPNDSLYCNILLTKIMDNHSSTDILVRASAINNDLTTMIEWNNDDAEKPMSGIINATGQLYENEHKKPEAQIHILPSHLMLQDSRWDIMPSDVMYTDNRLVIDHFAIEHKQQHLFIDGIASDQLKDSLTVDLQDIEVAYILDLVNFHSVEFSGQATGKAFVSNVFNDPSAWTKLQVKDFKFERGKMGTLNAEARWNKKEEQIDIQAIADNGPDAMTFINGYVSPAKNFIDLNIRAEGTYLDFMHNFTSSFISQITGHGYGELELAGPLDVINLTGQLVVSGNATIAPLNTTYELRNDTIEFIPDEIILNRIPVYDKYGNLAYLSGGVHHQHLTHLTFDLYVATDNLLAYDFKDFAGSSFYGTVFAGGNVAIHGRPGEVIIDANVTPRKNTVFVYNAAQPDAINNQEFIYWNKSNDTSSTSPSTIPAQSSSTDIYMNFLINTSPDATMRLLMDDKTNDYITLNGDGIIRASYHNKGAFNMYGTYTVRKGTYGITIQNIIQKDFTFNEGGTIVFGGDPYDASLNLQAVHTVQSVSLSDLSIGNSFSSNNIRVNCLMNITGQAKAPRVDFDLDMPTVNADETQMIRSIINGEQEMNQQVLFLLGIGRFYTQGQNNATSEQTDQASLAMQSFLSGTLSAQINNVLNQVIKNDDWNFGANISTGNEGWHNAEYEGVINGRMLNNRLLINGQFGYRDNATKATPSFIGDFDIRYLLYPNGNLALKVYNQTNDRFFTRSSLNTQGIGIIMKKDFNGFSDLLNIRKKKGKNSKK